MASPAKAMTAAIQEESRSPATPANPEARRILVEVFMVVGFSEVLVAVVCTYVFVVFQSGAKVDFQISSGRRLAILETCPSVLMSASLLVPSTRTYACM